ncbi:hypothetical protein P154DRAFT_577907 [Amniculicola lignicola CBS 123094]|uniref:Uncharacterized protein n=1 Tax=Amniculicola lignicola CBS 123094 TaxID=1392246 RepID=A0A6A5W9I5_9PLEO|nr:hypothetical protein P154DRAFT_577907 [Amniculicola lignicola CBS 123094]
MADRRATEAKPPVPLWDPPPPQKRKAISSGSGSEETAKRRQMAFKDDLLPGEIISERSNKPPTMHYTSKMITVKEPMGPYRLKQGQILISDVFETARDKNVPVGRNLVPSEAGPVSIKRRLVLLASLSNDQGIGCCVMTNTNRGLKTLRYRRQSTRESFIPLRDIAKGNRQDNDSLNYPMYVRNPWRVIPETAYADTAYPVVVHFHMELTHVGYIGQEDLRRFYRVKDHTEQLGRLYDPRLGVEQRGNTAYLDSQAAGSQTLDWVGRSTVGGSRDGSRAVSILGSTTAGSWTSISGSDLHRARHTYPFERTEGEDAEFAKIADMSAWPQR